MLSDEEREMLDKITEVDFYVAYVALCLMRYRPQQPGFDMVDMLPGIVENAYKDTLTYFDEDADNDHP